MYCIVIDCIYCIITELMIVLASKNTTFVCCLFLGSHQLQLRKIYFPFSRYVQPITYKYRKHQPVNLKKVEPIQFTSTFLLKFIHCKLYIVNNIQ